VPPASSTSGAVASPNRSTPSVTPFALTVVITDAFKRVIGAQDETMTVTVVAFAPGDTPNDVLQFDTIRLLTYQ